MEAFFGTVLIIFASIYLLGKLSKVLLRYYINKKIKEAAGKNGNFSGNFGNFGGFKGFYTNFSGAQEESRQETRKEGEIHIDKPASKEKKVSEKIGDYVDYEEVE